MPRTLFQLNAGERRRLQRALRSWRNKNAEVDVFEAEIDRLTSHWEDEGGELRAMHAQVRKHADAAEDPELTVAERVEEFRKSIEVQAAYEARVAELDKQADEYRPNFRPRAERLRVRSRLNAVLEELGLVDTPTTEGAPA